MNNNVFELLKNKGIETGSIVVSKAGHDKGRVYIVFAVENKMALIGDGAYRSRNNPKKKRTTHLKKIGILKNTEQKLDKLAKITDETSQNEIIQKWIMEFIDVNE